jgi:hypothetical protein
MLVATAIATAMVAADAAATLSDSVQQQKMHAISAFAHSHAAYY